MKGRIVVLSHLVWLIAVLAGSQVAAGKTIKETDNPQAHEFFLKGLEHYRRYAISHYPKAMEYFEQATELDPDYSSAYSAMASIYWKSINDEFYQVFHIDRTTARERAQQLLELANRKPTSLTYQASSDINLWWHRHDEAVRDGEMAIDLDPEDAGGFVALATALIFSGQPQGAFDLVDKAERLDPMGKAYYEFVRGMAYFGMEEFDKAANALERARELNQQDWAGDPENACRPCGLLLSTYGHLGYADKAVAMLEYIWSFWNAFTVSDARQFWPFKKEKDAERLEEGFRKAGVPE